MESKVSQFMICYSKQDLTKLECTCLLKIKNNKELLKNVKETYFRNVENDNVWVLEGVDELFVDAQKYLMTEKKFESTHLYNIIKQISDICETIIFWYGSEYDDLDVVNDKNQLFLALKDALNDSMCECYSLYRK